MSSYAIKLNHLPQFIQNVSMFRRHRFATW